MRSGGRKRTRGDSRVRPGSIGGMHQDPFSIPAELNGDEESDGEFGAQADSGVFEAGSFASRCSVRVITEVVSKFCSRKKELVKAVGFEGILHFPAIKQFNRRFSMWLMSGVHVETCTLVIGEHIKIKMAKNDVSHLFGLPSSGKKVVDDRSLSREAKESVLNKYLGARFREHRSIKVVQSIVEREYNMPMSDIEEETFKVAFVVFVVSNLLAPSAKNDYASIDYWNAIADSGALHTYDWADFVIVKLLEAVTKLKHDLSSNIKFPIVTGCSVFLQVLYLDSLDLGELSMSHNIFLRIRVFSYEKIRAMILADRNYERHVRSDDGIACQQLRDPIGCVYSWASSLGHVRREPRGGCFLALWEAVVAMVHLLNIPLEAAGPLYVAAADFQEQVNAGLLVTGTQAMKLISVLVSIMMPYKSAGSKQGAHTVAKESEELVSAISNGIRHISQPCRVQKAVSCNMPCGQCSSSVNELSASLSVTSSSSSVSFVSSCSAVPLDRWDIGDEVEKSFSSAVASLDEMPHQLNVGVRVAKAMSQYYSVIRSMKRSRGIDLNCEYEDRAALLASSHSPSSVIVTSLPSPWEAGYEWYRDGVEIDLESCIERLRQQEGMAIVHRDPKYIQVSVGDFVEQAMGDCEMEHDMFDALVRTVRQRDDDCYSSFGRMRWRVFFESDFMDRILSGSVAPTESSVCDKFLLGSSSYDISKCKIVFIPAMLQCGWVCFAWQIQDNVIYVFDPSCARSAGDSRVVAIERACLLVKLAMQELSSSVFGCIRQKCRYAAVRMLSLPDSRVSRYGNFSRPGGANPARFNRTGALCYMFMCCFDGLELIARDSTVSVDRISAVIVKEVLGLKNNGVIVADGLAEKDD